MIFKHGLMNDIPLEDRANESYEPLRQAHSQMPEPKRVSDKTSRELLAELVPYSLMGNPGVELGYSRAPLYK